MIPFRGRWGVLLVAAAAAATATAAEEGPGTAIDRRADRLRDPPGGAAESRRHLRRRGRRDASAQAFFLVRGHGTDLCWTVGGGCNRAGSRGGPVELDRCDPADPAQRFARSSYTYDAETASASWLFRPAITSSSAPELYLVGRHRPETGGWDMALDVLEDGVTDPLTQVFWTVESRKASRKARAVAEVREGTIGDEGGAILMGMGSTAYSTRLFVTNDGGMPRRGARVVLRTEKRMNEEERRRQTGEGKDPKTKSGVDALGSGVIRGKWSYQFVD